MPDEIEIKKASPLRDWLFIYYALTEFPDSDCQSKFTELFSVV